MLKLSGYTLNENLRICPALQKILGIGLNKADQINNLLGFVPHIYLNKLNFKKRLQLDKIIIHFIHGFRVKRNKDLNIKLIKEIKAYKGIRHTYCLSVRGQRTKTNAQTQIDN